jgi:PPK2 family polyphosphate:nucleotide phosphotransferase
MSDKIDYAFRLKGGEKVHLKDYNPDYNAGLVKDDAAGHFESYNQELGELQELMYAAGKHSVLIVLQGMDTSGKDGTIRHVMSSLNPQGCVVASFKVPTELERNHDFLWRIHQKTPERGMIGIFNRSHYEDVLVVRVHNIVPEKVWRSRYEHINHFEQLLADGDTIVLKFFLHISKEEQLERLLARENEPDKRWKLNWGDYKERNHWDEYIAAFEDALAKCSTNYAPWYIVPANRKWYRNLAVAETLVEALRPYRPEWEQALQTRGDAALKLVIEERAKTQR